MADKPKKATAAQRERMVRLAGLSRLLTGEDPTFRKFCFELFGKSRMFQSTQGSDPYRSSYDEGFRGLGLYVLDECCAAHPGALMLILNEGGGTPGLSSKLDPTTQEIDHGGYPNPFVEEPDTDEPG